MTAELDKDKKDYYTYQLKSAKGMQIVLKGIDSCVDPFEVKGALSDLDIVIASVYSPPRFTISADQYEEFYKSLGTRFLAAGDYNAKHTYWGSRLITPRVEHCSTQLQNWTWTSSRPTKIPDVIDFGVTKNTSRELVDVQASLDLSSDHSPTIVSIRIPQRYELPSHI
ncbi:RNA-directed DNA polymerase from mobile element jockey [Eumeta japonica]|uniref:RNA-directed DNA polymerase from mobile element jockey n=1 Tax=Eumeta variegata TaxID=151549 RepID=A0A4C1SFY4_EUMVA|nr:RNA-directed DNA polymerase from mobile element jockey [Eumeta japonica]